MTPPITIVERANKSGFVIDLREYEQLASEYICERFPPQLQLSEQLRLSDFIVWLRKRTEADQLCQRERQSAAAARAEVCQCEVYQTCDICRGTDRDFSKPPTK